MENLKMALYTVVVITVSFYLGCFSGEKNKQTEIENRAKKIEKECYTETELEVIIFGKSQL